MYRCQSADTSERVDRFLMDAYRRMPPWQKVSCIRSLSQASYQLAAAGVRARRPDASDDEIRLELATRRLGRDAVMLAMRSR